MRFRTAIIMVCVAPAAATAQQGPSVRPIGATVATSPSHFRIVSHVRHLSDGQVVINDAEGHRVLMLDSTLQSVSVIIDSASGTSRSYGTRAGALVPYLGDTTLFVDERALAFVALTPSGTIGRVFSLPPDDYTYDLSRPQLGGYPVWHPTLGLIYGGQILATRIPPRPAVVTGKITFEVQDTTLVLRMRESRALDTIVRFTNGNARSVTHGPERTTNQPSRLFFPSASAWALMSDGTIALLNGPEYRIEFVEIGGERSVGPRVPFPWRKLGEADKQRIVDSVNAKRTDQYNAIIERWRADSLAATKDPVLGKAWQEKAARLVMRALDGEVREVSATAPPNPPLLTEIGYVPDYLPAIVRTRSFFMADAENRLWVLPVQAEASTNGLIYDVIDRAGHLIDRVRLPVGRVLVGFGPGVAYLEARDAGMARLEKVRIK